MTKRKPAAKRHPAQTPHEFLMLGQCEAWTDYRLLEICAVYRLTPEIILERVPEAS